MNIKKILQNQNKNKNHEYKLIPPIFIRSHTTLPYPASQFLLFQAGPRPSP